MKIALIAFGMLLWVTGAGAQVDVHPSPEAQSTPVFDNPSAAERAAQSQQLVARRQQLETDFTQAMTVCYQKFDVTSCRLEARERRLQAQAVLRKDEIAFNTLDRRLRAEEAERRSAENNALALEREKRDRAMRPTTPNLWLTVPRKSKPTMRLAVSSVKPMTKNSVRQRSDALT